MNSNDGMSADEIKLALHERGYRSKDIAAKFGVTESMVSRVIHGAVKSARISDYIHKILQTSNESIKESIKENVNESPEK